MPRVRGCMWGQKLPAGRPALFDVYPDRDSTSVQAQLSIHLECYINDYQQPEENYHQKTNQLVGRYCDLPCCTEFDPILTVESV